MSTRLRSCLRPFRSIHAGYITQSAPAPSIYCCCRPLRQTSSVSSYSNNRIHSRKQIYDCSLNTHTRTRNINTMSSATSFYDFDPVDKKGENFPLSSLKGKVVLVVNTASKCGFTPQLTSLEKLHKSITESHPDTFTVLGFPCNQFGNQDPGSDDEIQSFCSVNYGVTFPVLGKTEVNGDNAAPVWTWLKTEKPGLMGMKRVKWNFEKFLVGADGKVVGRWASTTKPEALEETILKEIEKVEKKDTTAAATADTK